jgi:hypothetical protein
VNSKIYYFYLLIFQVFIGTARAGDPVYDNSGKVIQIQKSNIPIKLDGDLNDAAWLQSKICTGFWHKFPTNETMAEPNTEVKITYDDKYLYFGVTVYETKEGNIVQSLKRDIGLRAGDGIGIVLDPVNLKTNGFYFSLTPFNSQTEGLIGNSTEDIAFTWDNTWYSETKNYEGFWTAEIAIPFSILRFDPAKLTWGINFIRSARSENEFHTWTQMPLQFPGTDLGYLGQMVWDQSPPKGGSKVSLNPYITTRVNTDAENNTPTKAGFNAGVDAKIAVSPSINLDLTVNPDFSNVDVDQQVTNLTRFSIFFPERRVFFLENDDLFSGYGIPPVRPFYTRRIGSKNGQNVPILFGARLTGNINKKLRVGLMNIQTGRKGESAADNFTTLTFNHQVLDRSVVKGYFINRTAFQNENEKVNDPQGAFGRNAGGEFNYFSKSGVIQGWSGFHASMKPGIEGENIFANSGGGYFGRNFTSFIDFVTVGKNYYADVGFVNRVENYDAQRDTTYRVGFNFLYNETGYTWYPKDSKLNLFSFKSENFLAFDDQWGFNELTVVPKLSFEFKNAARINFVYNINRVNLLFPFKFVDDPEATPLGSGIYAFNNGGAEFSTDARKNLVLTGALIYGKFYGADYTQIRGSINLRKQPYYSILFTAEYNDLKFGDNFGTQKFWLLAPQIEINFSNKLFWTSFLQWNSQIENFNINSRIQYRFKPMCDMFLVYTDNYFTDMVFKNQNRALVFKANYWLNI